jgi:hypothetical protein
LLTLGLSALAAYAIASGIGLWRGDRWGWWLAAFYYVASAFNYFVEGPVTIWRISQVDDELLPFIGPAVALRLTLHVLLVLYCFKRSVRSFFGIQSLSILKALAILIAITIAIGIAMGFVVFLITVSNR